MSLRWATLVFVAMLCACASTPTPPAASPEPPAPAPSSPHVDVAANNDAPPPTIVVDDAAERARAPSTASYDQALSTPEPVDIEDGSPHLTDVQLWVPMRGALRGCGVPRYAKVTIKTAVQYGHAIGVTVDVHIDHPKTKKPPKPAAVKAERKWIEKMTACVDHNVRMSTWPPNRRRDSFTTQM